MKKDTLKARAQSAKSAAAINDMVGAGRGGAACTSALLWVWGGAGLHVRPHCGSLRAGCANLVMTL